MLLELDYSTFVLLPGTRNPSVGMMMQTSPGGATVVLDEHLVELESTKEPSSPSFSSQPSTPPFGARPLSPKFPVEEAPPCRNGANCTIPMCTYSHPSSHFSNRSRLSFSSAPFMPSFSPTSSPVKHRYEPNKYNYDNPPSRTSSSESKHYEVFAAPLGLSSRTPSVSSSRSSTSSNSPERSPDLPTRSLAGPNRRMVPSRKQGHFDVSFGPQTNVAGLWRV